MAPRVSSESIAALRAVSYYVGAASVVELPHVVVNVSQSLLQARDIFAHSSSLKQGDGEAGLALHRFNTQIKALLQGRTAEERFAATVLIKAAVESGGWEVLSKSRPWVNGLLSNLKRGDPASIRALITTTLTRIFMLTWDYPTLVREMTTPDLPAFITTCLNNFQSRSTTFNERQTILESFASLLPHHPTVFRGFKSEISRVSDQYLPGDLPGALSGGTASSSQICPSGLCESAQRVATLLHYCEPRQGSGAAWESAFQALINTAHARADVVLVDVKEDWQPVGQSRSDKQVAKDLYQNLDRTKRNVQLRQHAADLEKTLDLLHNYLLTSAAGPVAVPIGGLTELLERLLTARGTLHFEEGVSQEERDLVMVEMLRVHLICVQIISGLVRRYSKSLISVYEALLDQICKLFQAESADSAIRTASYLVIKELLLLVGKSLTKTSVKDLQPIVQACCEDVMPSARKTEAVSRAHGQKQSPSRMDADSFLKPATGPRTPITSLTGLTTAAADLLPLWLSNLHPEYLSEARRTQIDRTAILTRNKNALVASVMQPRVKQKTRQAAGGLLTFLAHEFPQETEVEALLRPRMPVIKTNQEVSNEESDDTEMSEQDGQEEVEESIPVSEPSIQMEAAAHIQDPSPAVQAKTGQDTITSATETALNTRKRSAEVEEQYLYPKRQRASPIAQALLPHDQPDLPGTPSTSAALPRTVALDERPGQNASSNVATVRADTGFEQFRSAAGQPITDSQAQAQLDEDSEDDAENMVIPLDLMSSSDEEEDDDKAEE